MSPRAAFCAAELWEITKRAKQISEFGDSS
jgi:hypothetical protein